MYACKSRYWQFFLHKRGRGKNTPPSLKHLGGESSPRLGPDLKLYLEDWSLAAMTREEA